MCVEIQSQRRELLRFSSPFMCVNLKMVVGAVIITVKSLDGGGRWVVEEKDTEVYLNSIDSAYHGIEMKCLAFFLSFS